MARRRETVSSALARQDVRRLFEQADCNGDGVVVPWHIDLGLFVFCQLLILAPS